MITSPSRRLAVDVSKRWRLNPRSVRIIPNPVDSDLFRPGGAPPRNLQVLYVGRMERRKGVETLIDAMPNVLRAFPGAEVRLVGQDDPSGPGGSSMTTYLRGRSRELGLPDGAVHFTGRVDRFDLPGVYRDAAVCVIPSLYENFPYTCLEAMASGCAVVASDAGGIPEIVTNEVDGLLVQPGRPERLGAAILRLLGDSTLANRLRRQAPATIRDRFSRAKVAQETLRAYQSLAAKLSP
jgi:glycosyltransferase involved in cell wall biosynthesis